MPRTIDHPLYNIWTKMKHRCHHSYHHKFELYGGRGIQVCDRWRQDFWAFVADMGNRPSPEYSLDRIDNDGDYTPRNVRWATQIEQQRNRSNNVWVEINGSKYLVADLADQWGIKRDTLWQRLRRGMPIVAALYRPVRRQKPEPVAPFVADILAHYARAA